MLSWAEHEKSFITSGPEEKHKQDYDEPDNSYRQTPTIWDRLRREPSFSIKTLLGNYPLLVAKSECL